MDDRPGCQWSRNRSLRQRLEQVEETRQALARHIEALKLIARAADVKITIPARRRPRRWRSSPSRSHILAASPEGEAMSAPRDVAVIVGSLRKGPYNGVSPA